MRSRALLLLPALLSLAFAPAPLPRPDTNKEDLKRMQGTWELASFAVAGNPSEHIVGKMAIAGDRMIYYDRAGKLSTDWALVLDATKSPKWFAWKRRGPPGTVAFRGTYLLDKDALTLCYTSGEEQPADLDGRKPGRCTEVLKRRKP